MGERWQPWETILNPTVRARGCPDGAAVRALRAAFRVEFPDRDDESFLEWVRLQAGMARRRASVGGHSSPMTCSHVFRDSSNCLYCNAPAAPLIAELRSLPGVAPGATTISADDCADPKRLAALSELLPDVSAAGFNCGAIAATYACATHGAHCAFAAGLVPQATGAELLALIAGLRSQADLLERRIHDESPGKGPSGGK